MLPSPPPSASPSPLPSEYKCSVNAIDVNTDTSPKGKWFQIDEWCYQCAAGGGNKVTHTITQYRNNAVIWTGDIKAWTEDDDRDYLPEVTNQDRGKRDSGADLGQWEVGDDIGFGGYDGGCIPPT